MSNPGERKFQDSKTSSQSRHMHNKGKKLSVFYIWATICSGGPGWPIMLPSYPLTYINVHIKYGSNPIRILYVIVRTAAVADAA